MVEAVGRSKKNMDEAGLLPSDFDLDAKQDLLFIYHWPVLSPEPHITAKEAGKCSLFMCPRERDSECWKMANSLCHTHQPPFSLPFLPPPFRGTPLSSSLPGNPSLIWFRGSGLRPCSGEGPLSLKKIIPNLLSQWLGQELGRSQSVQSIFPATGMIWDSENVTLIRGLICLRHLKKKHPFL